MQTGSEAEDVLMGGSVWGEGWLQEEGFYLCVVGCSVAAATGVDVDVLFMGTAVRLAKLLLAVRGFAASGSPSW